MHKVEPELALTDTGTYIEIPRQKYAYDVVMVNTKHHDTFGKTTWSFITEEDWWPYIVDAAVESGLRNGSIPAETAGDSDGIELSLSRDGRQPAYRVTGLTWSPCSDYIERV